MTGSEGGAEPVVVHLPASPSSPAKARRLVADVLERWQCDDPERAAELLTSELVTNVVIHVRSSFDLRLELVEGVLRVAVTDQSSTLPVVIDAATDSERGRGLRLVSLLARDWGIRSDDNGKTVWFELPAHPRLAGT